MTLALIDMGTTFAVLFGHVALVALERRRAQVLALGRRAALRLTH